jgi:hypothetical protein
VLLLATLAVVSLGRYRIRLFQQSGVSG